MCATDQASSLCHEAVQGVAGPPFDEKEWDSAGTPCTTSARRSSSRALAGQARALAHAALAPGAPRILTSILFNVVTYPRQLTGLAARLSPEPMGQLTGYERSPNSRSSWSMISSGSSAGRSSLFTKVKIGSCLRSARRQRRPGHARRGAGQRCGAACPMSKAIHMHGTYEQRSPQCTKQEVRHTCDNASARIQHHRRPRCMCSAGQHRHSDAAERRARARAGS